MTYPLKDLCEEWLRKIELCQRVKLEKWGTYALESQKFFNGPHDWMWRDEYARGAGGYLDQTAGGLPTFRMSVNKVFEAVALFGPALYHQNPSILVSPLYPPDAPPSAIHPAMVEQYMAQADAAKDSLKGEAAVLQHYANWLQLESTKKDHARKAMTECIVTGLGILWTDIYLPRFSRTRYPRTSYVATEDVGWDADADYWEDVQYVYRRCCHPVNLVEREYGLKPGSLKAHFQSKEGQAQKRSRQDAQRGSGQSFDLLEYWKVFSKNGAGSRLKSRLEMKSEYDLEQFGDNCFLAVARGIPYPLNLPPERMNDPEEAFSALNWPIPNWLDEGVGGGWPFSRLHFYDDIKSTWPMPTFKPVIGELRFINWVMSFLADKTASSCRTYVAMVEAAGVEIQRQLEASINGNQSPYPIIKIKQILAGQGINDVVAFIQAPDFPQHVFSMVAQVMDMIDKRTGLTELVYGLSTRQMRSATEATVKEEAVSIRPDDMAQKSEDFLSEVALKELEAALWEVSAEEVYPILGEYGAGVWQGLQERGLDEVVRSFRFRVEAGSARKPNKQNKLRNLMEFGQYALPVLQQVAAGGQVQPLNAYLQDMATLLEVDASRYLIQPPQPSEPPPPGPEDGREEERLQMEKERHLFDMQLDAERLNMDREQAKDKANASH